MLRKTRESMTNSTLLFLERAVIGVDDPQVTHRPSKHRFEYANGSILAYGGMKDDEQREQIRGIGQDGGLDIAWLEEATQFEERDFNELSARLRAKASPWRQIILTTNPDTPMHWIYRRMIAGHESTVYKSRAQDNVYNPPDYLATLDSMTGIDFRRLARGEWCMAEGMIYDTWSEDEGGNVTEEADYVPGAGPVIWAVDDGYSAGSMLKSYGIDPATGEYVHDAHPRVLLMCQQKADGHIDVFDESYACLKLSDMQIEEGLSREWPTPEYAVHGPGSAEIRGRLYSHQIIPKRSHADVEESIKELRERIAPDPNNWRAVRVHPRCRHLIAEFPSCSYNPDTGKPMKQFDHGPDALRGFVFTLRFTH